MPDDQYCLRWNNHHPNLIAMFSSLLLNDQMVDVTLISENREIHAHKIVLSACSPFFQVCAFHLTTENKCFVSEVIHLCLNLFLLFLKLLKNIFLRNSCKHPVIVLTGIKYLHMKSLIEFIYNGEVNIYQENLNELLRIANILKIKGLDEMPSPQSTGADEADKIILENPFNKTIKVENLPSTSDYEETTAIAAAAPPPPPPPKTTKKRKSVSFSDTPEIVCGQQRSTDASSSSLHSESGSGSGNGKRKLRSLSDICSITKVQKQSERDRVMVEGANTNNADDDGNDTLGQANKNQQLVVTINPHAIYSSNESINMDTNQTMDNDNESSPKKQQQPQRSSTMSRKMIRKNENFLRALEAVRDEGIGFCKAAKIHGVNNRTLWLEYQKRGYPMKNARKKTQ